MAIGITPRIIARAVIKTGRSRVVAFHGRGGRPQAFIETNPRKARDEHAVGRGNADDHDDAHEGGVPVSHSENSAPEMATGSPLIATNGRVQDWKFTTITRKTRTAARPRPPINSEYDERISAAWPASSCGRLASARCAGPSESSRGPW